MLVKRMISIALAVLLTTMLAPAMAADTDDFVSDAANSVTSAEIVDNSVTSADILDNSVTGTDILDGTVDSADLADNSVTNAKMADNAIGNAEMADNAIGSAEVINNSLTSDDLGTDSVDSDEIAANAVGNAEMADNAIGSAEVINNSLTSDDLGTDSVASDEIATGAVGTDEVADGSLTDTDIDSTTTLSVAGFTATNFVTKTIFVGMHEAVRSSASAGTVAGGNSPVIRFDDSNDSQARWAVALPNDIDTTADITIEAGFSLGNDESAVTGTAIVLQLDYDVVAIDDVVTQGGGSFTNIDGGGGGTATDVTGRAKLDTSTKTFTIPNAQINNATDTLMFNLSRDPTVTNDDLEASVNIHWVRITWNVKGVS